MNIAILGAGAIGCFLGGALQAGGLQTTLILRERLKSELENAGCIILSDYRQLQLKAPLPTLSTNPEALKHADCILVTVKCLAVADIAQDIRTHAKHGAIIIALQNGIGSESTIANVCTEQTLVRGIVGFNVAPLDNGRFHCGTEGAIYCENSLPKEIEQTLNKVLQSANIEFHTTENFSALQFAKLQLNLNNAINALSNQPLKAELEQRAYRRALSLAMRELLNVCKAKNMTLPKLTRLPPTVIPSLLNVPDFLFKKLAASMLAIDPQARSSMWEDLANGRHTEVDFLNGAIVREAHLLGLKAPVNAKLVELIHLREQNLLNSVSACELLNYVRQ